MNTNEYSKGEKRAGWTLSAVASLTLVMSAVGKIFQPAAAGPTFAKFGYAPSSMIGIAALELACTALYLTPRTRVLGAILLTGYLGGATATHVRVNDPFFVPVALGVVVWAGIWLRDPRLRSWMPVEFDRINNLAEPKP